MNFNDLSTSYTERPVILDSSLSSSLYLKDFSGEILFENDFLAFCPEIFLGAAACILLLYGVFFATSKAHGYPLLSESVGHLAVGSLLCTFLLLCHNPIEQATCFWNCFIIDSGTFFFKLLCVSATAASILLSFDYIREEKINFFEYFILVLLASFSMLLCISSYDFLSFYLTLELQALALYVLAALKRTSEFSTEAGLKYFILGAFSSGIFLFGFSLLYGFTGLTNFQELAAFGLGGLTDEGRGLSASFLLSDGSSAAGILLGLTFVAVGFFFKLTAAPFHMWAPDVYEGCPTSVTAFFALVPKIAILAVFLRVFMFSFFDCLMTWQNLTCFVSVTSMVLGSVAAMAQVKMKRLIAFSSIGHMGYILLGLSCGTLEGIQATCIYLFIYTIMTLNTFAVILSLRSQHNGVRFKYISDLGMLAKTNPVLAFTLAMTFFSLAGIPPLAGFCSKFYLFFVALGSSLYSLAFIGVLSSVVSCFYYLRIVKIMYFEQPFYSVVYKQMDREKSLLLAITSFVILFFIFYPNPLFLASYEVAFAFWK